MGIVCPKCKNEVNGLVKNYSRINELTGKVEVIEFENVACEKCVEEEFEKFRKKK